MKSQDPDCWNNLFLCPLWLWVLLSGVFFFFFTCLLSALAIVGGGRFGISLPISCLRELLGARFALKLSQRLLNILA